MNTRKVDAYLKRLYERREWLESRIEETGAHYHRSELTAMNWAIRYIEDTLFDAAEHMAKYSDEIKKEKYEQNKIHDGSDHPNGSVREYTA